MQQNYNLEELDLVNLKALVYDLSTQYANTQKAISAVEAEIAKRGSPLPVEAEKQANVKKVKS